jgi:hypothetical protein
MRRTVPLVVGLALGTASFSACRDVAVSPSERSLQSVALNVPAVSLNELQASSEGVTYSLTVDPRKDNVYSDGINTIQIPAGSICDPATSSYGPEYWDSPCEPAISPIALEVTLTARDSNLVLYFDRDLRFVPSGNPAKHVVLTVAAPSTKTTTEPLRRFAVQWIPTGQRSLLDEGARDASLVTVVKRGEGRLVRRLKHFSGYYVHLGYSSPDCDPDVDEGCVERPEGEVDEQ